MTRLRLSALLLLCAFKIHAHPGHSLLDVDAAHQLTNPDHLIGHLLMFALVLLLVVRVLRRRKL